MDALAFCFYYAIKYKVKIEETSKYLDEILKKNDCIAILLAWKYAKHFPFSNECLDKFKEKHKAIKDEEKREQDRFWLFLYEYAETEKDLPEEQSFLKELKKEKVTFLKFFP